MTKLFRLAAVALLLTAAACTPTADKKTEAVAPADAATLQHEYAALRDTVDARWTRMTAADDEKIFFQKRLLQEISYIPGADVATVTRLNLANEKLAARRYQQATMVSDSIDAYDAAQENVLRPLRELASRHVETAKRPVLKELLDAIQAHDDNVVRYRGTYDQAARAYNVWLQEHEGHLPAANNARPVPLFSLTGA